MPRLTYLFALLMGVSLTFACQGEQGIPSEPGRGIDLSAAGPCKDAAFTAAVAIYVDSSVQSAKLQACKDILAAVKQSQVGAAEIGIDDLLVAIYNDYKTTPSVLQPLGSNTLPQSVANFIDAACGLAPLSASECLRPNDHDETPDGIDDDDLINNYLVVGPLFSTGTTLATGVLGSGVFGFGVEEADGTYVTVSARPRTGVDGPCPDNFPNDCQDDVYDVDVDGAYLSITVESCAVFAEFHIHCPENGDCASGEPTTELGLVTDAACTAAGYTLMGFWGQLAYQATRPMQWVVGATPAHAGLSTKLGATSPVTGADGDPRVRDVKCDVTANYPAGSEGTICTILGLGEPAPICVTTATGTYTSECTFEDILVPEHLDLVMTAAKTGGDGAYNASQAFSLDPGDPERGVTRVVTFNLQPPGKKKK